jgi:hypothetical protein
MATKRAEETTTFTMKFSAEERRVLELLVEARAAELHETTGQQVDVSVASCLRWLIDKEARQRGLIKPPAASTPAARSRRR